MAVVQCLAVGFGLRGQLFAFEAFEDEGVDGMDSGFGWLDSDGFFIGPVF